MCGIWFYTFLNNVHKLEDLYKSFSNIKNRGPDNSCFSEYSEFNTITGFHRLAIINNSVIGNQPFIEEIIKYEGETIVEDKIVFMLCNGEIYNYKLLAATHLKEEIKNTSLKSDCEIIIKLYLKYGHDFVANNLRGEYAYVIFEYDRLLCKKQMYVSRDPFGIRPLYYSFTNEFINICSETKGLITNNTDDKIKHVKGGSILHFSQENKNAKFTMTEKKYYNFPTTFINSAYNVDFFKHTVKKLLIKSVKERLVSDRPIGALLSGGLDSSLVCSIAASELRQQHPDFVMNTFSIGMPGSTDEKYANMVATHIKSNHRHISFDMNVWLDALETVIYTIESYDITTVRASTGQYLISKWISENTDIKVLLIGDGSDELCSGYMYFHNAPNPKASHEENIKLLDEISFYDVKRADAGIASNGLEARVPYLDVDFVNFYLQIPPEHRIPIQHVEKWLLRYSFDDVDNYLPKEVLYRKKEAFSDGVSSVEKSWFMIIQEYVEELYTKELFEEKIKEYSHNTPVSKESLYYREIYKKHFGNDNNNKIIPHYWLPNWSNNVKEPSARVLNAYKEH